MTPAERQTRLAAELLRIEDPQERLAFVLDRTKRRPAFAPEERRDECRITGCATKVWLKASLRDGLCIFEVDSESGMVRGLASLVSEVYTETTPEQTAQFECEILEVAKLQRLVTPTRQNGLAHLQNAIRNFALSALPADADR